jgi:hypothetical protein
MAQEIFKDTKFEWTTDWYNLVTVDAKAIRESRIKELKARGFSPRKFSLGMQLLSMGGIGSGKPHIEYHAKCFGINY